jgi:hypothetical protein
MTRIIYSYISARCHMLGLAPPSLISDIADLYSITLSARTNNAGGTVTPIALAVLRLITSSNLVGCSTGTSAGLTPRNSLTSW